METNKALGASVVEGRVRRLGESVGRNVSERWAGHETDDDRPSYVTLAFDLILGDPPPVQPIISLLR